MIAAQSSLERVIADLARSGVSTSVADAQLQRLAILQGSVGTANAATLSALSGDVAAAVTQAQTVAQAAREQVAATSAAELAQSLNLAATASRTAVSNAMDSLRHIPLKFTSAEDEAEYRKREEERRSYIAAEQAKHTPEGDLNAAGGGLGQMVDAKAHGAKGPEFDKRWNELAATTERLREQVRNSGGSTKEFDDHLREDIRRVLKSKGLKDDEIDAQFAAHNGDTLEAAKAFMKGDDDIRTVRQVAADAKNRTSAATNTSTADTHEQPSHDHVASAIALLKASGVTADAGHDSNGVTHGVTARAVTRTTVNQVG